MLSVLLRSITQAGRILRNFITRPFFILRSKLYYLTNLGRYLAKLPSLFTALPKALAKKPRKREDYASVGRVFMAKKYIVLIGVAVIVLPLLFYFLLWPIIQPLWFTVSYTVGDPRYNAYSGRVRIYFDEDRDYLMFEGRLLDGNYTEHGTLYHDTGFMHYNGTFNEGVFDEFGTIYNPDGGMLYEGGIAMGSYQGHGNLYTDSGELLYIGEFDTGQYSGQGVLYFGDGSREYEGTFLMGLYNGHGVLNSAPGSLLYTGFFELGLYHGTGELYNEIGLLQYNGSFERGLYHGWGEIYNELGNLIYEGELERGERSGFGTEYNFLGDVRYKGNFLGDVYDGQGTLYGDRGTVLYEGGFAGGEFDGVGKLAMADGYSYEGMFSKGAASGLGNLLLDGITIYSGDFADGQAQGVGTFTDRVSWVTFTGHFEDGIVAFGPLITTDVPTIYAAFETGMSEMQTETEYYLYNSTLGYVLCFDYATETTAARLTRMYVNSRAKLPSVGSEEALARFETIRRAREHPAKEPKEPLMRVQTLAEAELPDSAYAAAEVRGIVLATIWKTSRIGETLLYVFEPLPSDYETPGDEEEPSATADLKYYEKFGLEELFRES